jgi:hypothetical protein
MNIISGQIDAIPKNKHHIRLSTDDRQQPETILRKGQASAFASVPCAHLVPGRYRGPEGGWSDDEIARAAQASIPTVERVRRACVEHWLKRVFQRQDLAR